MGDADLSEVALWILKGRRFGVYRAEIGIIHRRIGVDLLFGFWDCDVHKDHLADSSPRIEEDCRIGYIRDFKGQATAITRMNPRSGFDQSKSSGYL